MLFVVSVSCVLVTALIGWLNCPFLVSLLASQNESAISLTFEDKKNLALLRSIVDLIGPRGVNQSLRSILAQDPGSIDPEIVASVAPGLSRMSSEFGEKFSKRLVERSSDDIAAMNQR